jgi:hypothetical protein
MPAYAHALAHFPGLDAISQGVDYAGDFMTGDARILDTRPTPFFREKIAVTNPAGFDAKPNLARTWLGDLPLHDLKRPARFWDLCCFHGRHARLDAGLCEELRTNGHIQASADFRRMVNGLAEDRRPDSTL